MTTIVTVIANLIPLVGVLWWDWRVLDVVLLYWLENVVVGLVNALKMLFCNPESGAGETTGCVTHASKVFFLPFFLFHYGMFCFVHGIFVITLLGEDKPLAPSFHSSGPFDEVEEVLNQALAGNGKWAVLALAVGHLFTFFAEFIGKKLYLKTDVGRQMFSPYGRIVVLHLAIIFGAFLIASMGSPIWMLVLLVIGKIAMELGIAKFGQKLTEKKEAQSA